MRNFRKSMSVTKLVFLILTIVLSFQTIYFTVNWTGTDLFNNVMLMVVSFYFWQKVGNNKADPLINNEENNGQSL